MVKVAKNLVLGKETLMNIQNNSIVDKNSENVENSAKSPVTLGKNSNKLQKPRKTNLDGNRFWGHF